MNADEILDEADARVDEWREHIRPAANFFHEHEGKLFKRTEALVRLQDKLDVRESVAQDVLSELVGDTVDPIVQIPHAGERYVGVVEFHEFDGAYGYIEFDDRFGKAKRVVCQKCVNEAETDNQVVHATAGDPAGSFDESADYDELLDGIQEHYNKAHDKVPEDVETGASLASGTTIGGSESWHKGNDGDLYLTTGNDTFRLETRTSDPSNPNAGEMWIRTDL